MGATKEPKNIVLLGDVFKIGHELGLQDERAQEIYRKWLRGVEGRVEKADTPLARVKLEITCAEIYLELDMTTEAAACFRDALIEARQEGLREIVRDLERALQTVER